MVAKVDPITTIGTTIGTAGSSSPLSATTTLSTGDSLSSNRGSNNCLPRLFYSAKEKVRSLLLSLRRLLRRILKAGENLSSAKTIDLKNPKLSSRIHPPQLERTGPNVCWIDSTLQMLFASPNLLKAAIRGAVRAKHPEMAKELLRLASSDKEVEGINAPIFFNAFSATAGENHTDDAMSLAQTLLAEEIPFFVLYAFSSKEQLETEASHNYQSSFPHRPAPEHLLLNLNKASHQLLFQLPALRKGEKVTDTISSITKAQKLAREKSVSLSLSEEEQRQWSGALAALSFALSNPSREQMEPRREESAQAGRFLWNRAALWPKGGQEEAHLKRAGWCLANILGRDLKPMEKSSSGDNLFKPELHLWDSKLTLPIPQDGLYQIAGGNYQIVSAILYLPHFSPAHYTTVTSYPDPNNPALRDYYYCDDLQRHLPKKITREEFDKKIETHGALIHLERVKNEKVY